MLSTHINVHFIISLESRLYSQKPLSVCFYTMFFMCALEAHCCSKANRGKETYLCMATGWTKTNTVPLFSWINPPKMQWITVICILLKIRWGTNLLSATRNQNSLQFNKIDGYGWNTHVYHWVINGALSKWFRLLS